MKRIALLAVIAAGLLAMPGTAAAQESNCSTVAGPVGFTESDDPCVDAGDVGGEAVIRPSVGGCSYINGWEGTLVEGYAGICILAQPAPNGCDGSNNGSGANDGGCFWIKPLPVDQEPLQNPVTDMFICGNTSGENPQSSTRDGCFIP